VNGQVNQGLLNRRLGERSLFTSKGDVSMQQSTTITVSGSGDPQQTARAVADQQRQVNADILRDMAAKVQ